MSMKKIYLFVLLALGAMSLSACSGSRASIVNSWSGLSADGELAYLAAGSHVYAVDVTNGNEVWRYPAEADSGILFYATPVLTADGQLLIGSEGTNHEFISLDPATGKENWAKPFTGAKSKWVASPLVFNDTIYAPNSDGFLYILDMSGNKASDPIELGGTLWSSPVTDGTNLYLTSLDHSLYVIDMATGNVGEPVDLGGAAPSAPALGEGGVYVGSFSSKVEFIKSTGEREVLSTAANWIWGTPTLDTDTLYYADLSGNLYSMDLASAKQNWDSVQPDGPVVASPQVMEDQIYVVTESGSLLALDRDAKVVWEKTVGGNIYTAPAFSGNVVLVAPYKADFALAAYDIDGKQAWTFTPEK